MALCVRRLRGAPGLGGRWMNGVRGAGGAAGRHREVSRVHDAILFREFNPYPGIRTPVPPTAIVLSSRTKPMDIRRPSPTSERERALLQIKDIINQNKLAPKPVSQFLPNAEPCACHPFISECGYLSSAQLDCFRRLFEPAMCRTPFHAMSFPTPAAQDGLLEFTLCARTEGSEAPRSNQPSMEEHLAVMHEKLREELPRFLWKSLNLTLYRKDMEFTSSIYRLHIRGVVNYQLFLSFMKILLVSCYMNSQISILNLTSQLETNSIHVRWSFSGIPLQNLFFIFKRNKSELVRTYDFFSTFQLAPDGLICLHKLERVMPSPPLTVSKKMLLTAALLTLGLEQDRPALNLLSTPKLPDEL